MKLWHPHIKDLSIERDEAEVAAHVAAGWLKGPPRREFIEVEAGESVEIAVEESREKKSGKARRSKTSPATDEAN